MGTREAFDGRGPGLLGQELVDEGSDGGFAHVVSVAGGHLRRVRTVLRDVDDRVASVAGDHAVTRSDGRRNVAETADRHRLSA
ncbi:hypothetical protein GCM10011354_29190 [Egicoccus halophilus]|uniref:Uncharacterized protein n=1 Tax=Egicoccus halophilus TaxID=1670830 RepID=A0A8J3A9V6_9ACTN|nr:hypothetical protein GCM10011354_29190 [Egicoccus halophilus]